MSNTLFIRLLADDDKETALNNAIASLHDPTSIDSKIYTVNPNSFHQVPGSPFAYWVSDHIRQLFIKLPSFESEGRTVRVGLQTSDDCRFIRLWWEVEPEKIITGTTETTPEEFRQQTFEGKRWVPFAKGGEYSPYYADLHLVVNWERDGGEIRSFDRAFIRNENFYFQSGLTYPRRTTSRISFRTLPAGCIFADKGPGVFVDTTVQWLGLLQSSVFEVLMSLQLAAADAAARSYEAGLIQRTPTPAFIGSDAECLKRITQSAIALKRFISTNKETSHIFYLPTLLQYSTKALVNSFTNWQARLAETEQKIAEFQHQIDKITFGLYRIEDEDRQAIESVFNRQLSRVSEGDSEAELDEEITTDRGQIDNRQLTADLISHTVGCIFGRWDIRFATGEKQAPELPDPFAPLPVCSPGMLTDSNGLPLRETPANYPIQIDWDGILVDDSDHPDDIISRVGMS